MLLNYSFVFVRGLAMLWGHSLKGRPFNRCQWILISVSQPCSNPPVAISLITECSIVKGLFSRLLHEYGIGWGLQVVMAHFYRKYAITNQNNNFWVNELLHVLLLYSNKITGWNISLHLSIEYRQLSKLLLSLQKLSKKLSLHAEAGRRTSNEKSLIGLRLLH